jgi:hypothetical protein
MLQDLNFLVCLDLDWRYAEVANIQSPRRPGKSSPDSDGRNLLPYAQASDYSFVTSVHTLIGCPNSVIHNPDRANDVMTEVLGRKITRRNVSKQGILQQGARGLCGVHEEHNADGAERGLSTKQIILSETGRFGSS